MRGLTREERHQWMGQPGHWTCKRCRVVVQGSGALDDGLCVASMSGQLDYGGSVEEAARKLGMGSDVPWDGGPAARPTRLDTPERVRKDLQPTQQEQALLRSTGKGPQVTSDQGGEP